MRDAFAYESNVFLLRQILVPDPIGSGDWARALAAWEAARDGSSLMAWLVRNEVLDEDLLLAVVGEAAGVEVVRGAVREHRGQSPEEQLLRNLGFLVLDGAAGDRRVTGGAVIGPDLSAIAGPRAEGWKWVMISPLQPAAEPEARDGAAREAAASYGMAAWLRELLEGLCCSGAIDIHFERTGGRLGVRIHKGTGMEPAGEWHGDRAGACLRLLKAWAGLSQAEETLPQDGRIVLDKEGGRPLVLRASHVRTVDGESLVLRVLGGSREIRRLGELGLPAGLEERMIDCMLHAPGMVLCTGPTGSGKTTTAYALLAELGPHRMKILGIEDPVEHEIPFAVQSSVDTEAGWTFDAAIRAYLRQDPDVILVGEIRDKASAEAACRAALTGHRVLATLHGRSCGDALERLHRWGIPASVLAEAVRLVINQRLEPAEGTAVLQASFAWEEPDPEALYARLTGGRDAAAGPQRALSA